MFLIASPLHIRCLQFYIKIDSFSVDSNELISQYYQYSINISFLTNWLKLFEALGFPNDMSCHAMVFLR